MRMGDQSGEGLNRAREERRELESRAKESEAECAAKGEAVRAYFERFGAEHEEGCPEDSTCTCSLIVGINKAFGPGRPGAALLEELRQMRQALAEATSRAEKAEEVAHRLYVESWGAAVKVAEVLELLEAEAFSADVLRLAQGLSEQRRKQAEQNQARAEQAERERDEAREKTAAALAETKDLRREVVRLAKERDTEQILRGQAEDDARAAREHLERTRKLETAARFVISICDKPTLPDMTDERIHEMGIALVDLRAVLEDLRVRELQEVRHG